VCAWVWVRGEREREGISQTCHSSSLMMRVSWMSFSNWRGVTTYILSTNDKKKLNEDERVPLHKCNRDQFRPTNREVL
jgi:hypothetical protein